MTTLTRRMIAPLPPLLPPPSQTAPTPGRHASSVTAASAQAVAAVVAAWRSSLRWGAVRYSSSSKQNAIDDTCFFHVFLVHQLNVCYMWHRMPYFLGPFHRIPDYGRFRNKSILPWND